MKKLLKLIFAVLILVSKSSFSQCTYTANITSSGSSVGCGNRTLTASSSGDVWTQKANYAGVARQYAASFSIGSKGYIGTGITASSTYTNDFWEYDPSTNSWSQKANFSGAARYGAVGFSIGTKGYIGTGYTNTWPYYTNDFWEYNPSTNFWSQKANFSGYERYYAVGFSIGSKGYIGTGTGSSTYNDFWEYDPNTNFWTQKANFAGGSRYGAVGFSINTKGYLGTGNSNYNDMWEFDPTTNTWTQKANIGSLGLYGAVAFNVGNNGYVVSGFESSNSYSDKVWQYDPAANTWTQKTGMGSSNARRYATGFSIGQKGYIGTGYYGGSVLNTFWEYEATGTYSWSTGSTLQAITASVSGTYSVLVTTGSGCTATATQTLALSPNPTISVSGGTNVLCGGSSNTLVASGASTYTWSSNAGGGNSNTAIVSPTVGTTYTLSGTTGTCTLDYPITVNVNPAPIATISVSGPTLGCGTLTLSTNAGGNTWTQKAGLNVGRQFAVGFSIGNKGYIGTGYNGSYYNDFWEYDPGTNSWTQKANFAGTARYGAVGFSIGSKGYLGTGYNGSTFVNDFWEYDPAVNTWTQKANFGGLSRYFAVGFNIGTKGYLGTGYTGSYSYDFWEYDPIANSWTQKTNFGGSGRYLATGFSVGTKGYIGTGYTGSYSNDFWEYDPTANIWTQKTNYPGGGVQAAASFGLGNRGYIAISTSTNTLFEFNPTANTWTQKATFPGTSREGASSFVIGSKAFLGLGYSSSTAPYYMNDVWEYNPSNTILWSTSSTLQAIPVSTSGMYTVTITNQSGCSSTASQSVALSPNPTISVSGGTNVLCGGSSNTLVASGASTYTWSSNAGGGNSSTAIVSPAVPTTYTLSGTSGTCTVDYPISVDVITVPVASIAVSGPTLGCGTLTLNTNAGGNTWTQKAGLNVGREYGVSFSIGTKGYMGTGYNGNSSPYYFSDFWEYDPSTNSWSQKANYGGGARYNAVGFSIGSKGYIGTGYSTSNYTNDFWEYDPTTNTWTQKANFGGLARYSAVGFSIGTKGYIGTGVGSSYYNDFWEYNPSTNTWTQKANFGGSSRYDAVGFSIGTKGYIGTGYYSGYTSDFWEYDPTANTWTQKANYAGGGTQAGVGFSIGNKGYIGTGNLNSGVTTQFYEYNPTANTWTQKANFGGVARNYATGFSIGAKGYLGLGYSSTSPYYMNDVWEYNPSNTILWSTSSTLQAIPVSTSGMYTVTITNQSGCSSTASQSVALSPNPTISVSGGTNVLCGGSSNTLVASGASTYTWSSNAGGGNSSTAIVSPTVSTTYTLSGTSGTCTVDYPISVDVITVPVASIAVSGPTLGCGTLTLNTNAGGNTWTQKAGLNMGREYGVSFSIGTKGYMGTGYNGNISPYTFSDFWEYDPSTNSWSQKANYGGGARQGAVGFSIGSKGYIGTGYATSNYTNDFWEYDPTTNIWTQKANFAGTIRYLAVGFGIGTKGYLGTGYSGSYLNDFWEYNPTTNAWTQKTSFGGLGRYFAAAFSIGTKGYIGTGIGSSSYSDFWEYDPTANSWTQKANYAGGPTEGATGLCIGSKGYIGTGNGSAGPTNTFYEYNPTANTWTQKANFGGSTRAYANGFSIGTKGYLGLGYSNSTSPYYMNDVWEYDPSNTILWSTSSTLQAIPVSTSGMYTVTITNQSGCSSTASQSVALSPNPTISVSGGTNVLCGGSSNTLVASGASTYTWSSNAGGGNSSTAIVSPTVSTTYTLSGTSGTCTVDYPISVDVIPSPVASIIPIGSTTICGSAITLSSNIPAANVWTQKAGLNVGREYAIGFSIGSKGYMGTGYNGNSSPYYYSDFWEYDPSTNSWTQKANFGGGTRYGAVGFTIGNKGYVGTGYTGSTYANDFWEYDPTTNIWTQKANFGGTARYLAVGFSVGTKGYIGTGNTTMTSYANDFWEYDPSTNFWTQKTNFGGTGRYGATAFSLNGSGYVGTGYDGSNKIDFWQYNPSTNFWTQKANIGGSARTGAASFVLGNKAYVSSGSSGTDTWEYNPTTNVWTQKANVPTSYHAYPVAFSIGTKGYLGTGYGGSVYLNDFWEYEPGVIAAWSTGSSLSSITATLSGAYSLTLTNTAGCSSSASQLVSITPNPTVAITGPLSICNGATVSLNANGATSYTWSANAANATTSSVSVSPNTTTSYSVIGSVNNCTVGVTKNITVNQVPAVAAVASSTSLCDGGTVTLSGSGANTYSWTGGVTNNVAFTPTINGSTYTVTGTDLNTCTNTAVVSLTVKPSPTVAVNGGTICAGQQFTLQPTGGLTYTYSGGSALVSPNTTTSYSVTGYNSVGCPNAIPAVATVTVFNIPLISAASGTICYGKSYTITPGGASSYTFSSGSSIVSPTTTSSYSVTGTSTAGCLSPSATVVNVTVNPLPIISVNSGSVCNGQSFTLTPTGGVSYTYSSGSAVVSPAANTSYSVSGANAYGCLSASPAVANVTVMNSPTVTVNSGSICNGQSFTMSPSGALSYSYSNGSAVVAPGLSTSYTVTGYNSIGCPNAIPAVANVTVNQLPVISVNNASICYGESYTISPSGALSYTYSGGSAIVSPTTTTTYSVSGTSAAGCETNSFVTLSITVNTLPIVSVNSGSICSGQSFVLVPSGASTYSYSSGTATVSPNSNFTYSVTGISTQGCLSASPAISQVSVSITPTIILPGTAFICTGNTYTISPTGAYSYTYSGGSNVVAPNTTTTYTVQGESAEGCQASVKVITVSVQASLVVTISGPTVVCDGQSVTLNVTGANTYTWNTGSTNDTIVVTPTSYTVITVNAGSGNCLASSSQTISVNPNPTLTLLNSNDVLCANETGTITVSGASNYTWSNGSNANLIVITPTVSETYTVDGTDANGCKATAIATQSVSDCLNVKVNAEITNIEVYPNPNNGLLNIKFNSLHKNASVELHNYIGQTVLVKELNEIDTQIKFENLANGVYTVKIISNNETILVRKIIKE